MIPTAWWALLPAALAMTALALLVVARHPEPDGDDPDIAAKPRYAALLRPASIAGLLITSALLVLGVGWLPAAHRPGWLVWASVALVLVWVDARTTWLPIRLTRATAALLVAGLLAGAVMSGEPAAMMLRALLGALAAGGIFALIWRFSGALGFGDVRLATLAGGLLGAHSASLWSAGILAGTLAAACWGVVTTLWRRRHPSALGKVFAYGPGLWLGCWIGLAWLGLSP